MTASRPGRKSGPRIRTLKPEVWQDERFVDVSLPARLFYVGLITQADDHGRQSANQALLRSRIFPFDELELSAIDEWLDELQRGGLVERYEAAGRTYLSLISWLDDQRVEKPTTSKIPPPEHFSGNPREESPTIREGSPKAPAGPDQDQDRNGPGRRAHAQAVRTQVIETILAPVAKRIGIEMPTSDQIDALLAEHPSADERQAARDVQNWSNLRDVLGALRHVLVGMESRSATTASAPSSVEPCPNGTTDTAALAAWDAALPTLRGGLPDAAVGIYVQALHPHRIEPDGTLVLAAPSLELEWIRDRLIPAIDAAIDGEYRLVPCGGHS